MRERNRGKALIPLLVIRPVHKDRVVVHWLVVRLKARIALQRNSKQQHPPHALHRLAQQLGILLCVEGHV